jgi:acyl-coenzyme A synthetase/AMP-(fatty) acid ligase
MSERTPSYKMIRELPEGVKVVNRINGIDLYNINTFQNIMSWNQHNLDIPAFEYFGNTITYGQLPKCVEEYTKGFARLGIKRGSVVTMSLPVTIEYYLSLFAAVNLGVISNNVNFLFLRNNMAKYTLEKNSDTLIILDVYLPLIAEQLQKSEVRNVILTSLSDYLPEEKKTLFDNYSKLPKKVREFLQDQNKMDKAMKEIAQLNHVNFIKMSEVVKAGREDKNQIVYPEVDIKRDSMYSYTSGTTGAPKCIVFNEQSPNAIIEMHNGLNLRDYVGDRSLVVIPPSHATGMFYATYLQLAKGKTLVLQPIYDKKTFATDLRDYKINHTLAAASFYLEAVAQNNIKSGEYSELTRPCSGGELITKSNVLLVNEWLKNAGCPEKVAIGGGSGEVGSSALTSYELNPDTKTNETGYPIPGVYVKIVDPKTGEEVPKGERGILHISSAASADRYLNNQKATDDYYYVDEDGVRWANLGDIAVQNEDNSISMLGRASDSYVDENGETKYLFDIEYSLSLDDSIIEWEITAFPTKTGKTDVVAQVVLKKNFIGEEESIVKYICEKYKLDGVKFYDEFETSEVTGKRDYQLLKHDYEGYYSLLENGKIIQKNYLLGGEK